MIRGYVIEHSLEPPHPQCTTSDPTYAALAADGTPVVIKVLHLHFPLRDASRATFLAAMQRAQAITSPHVVRTLAAGFTDAGEPYIVMERVTGPVLASLVGTPASLVDTRRILGELVGAFVALADANLAPSIQMRHVALTETGARVWGVGVHPWRHQGTSWSPAHSPRRGRSSCTPTSRPMKRAAYRPGWPMRARSSR